MLHTSKNIKDLNISKVSLINYLGEVVDLSALFIQINIYESIFNNFISGDILINDGVNLLNNFPIICQEKIVISFSNPSLKQQELIFNVINISDIKNSINNDKVQNYVLHFTTKEVIKNRLVNISRRLKGKTDDVLYDLLTQDWSLGYKGNFKIEKSDSFTDFVVPRWSPLETINYIVNRSIPENRKFPTYLFYQDFDNYNIISYDSLLEADVKETFYYAPANIPSNYDIDEKSKNINQYMVSGYLDLLKILDSRLTFNQYLEVDLTSKKMINNQYKYDETFNDISTLYDNSLLPKKNLDNFDYMSSHKLDTLYNLNLNSDMKKFNKWYLYRQSWLSSLQNIKIKIETTENTSRRLGDLIEFNIPSREESKNKMKYSDYISGKFIISKIRHTIGNDLKGVATLEIIKDSFSTKLPEEKMNG